MKVPHLHPGWAQEYRESRRCRDELEEVESKRTTFRQNDRPLNYILQLAHVAGPIVALQFLHVKLGQARTRNSKAARGLFDKVFGKLPDIFETLAQRRDLDWEDAETI